MSETVGIQPGFIPKIPVEAYKRDNCVNAIRSVLDGGRVTEYRLAQIRQLLDTINNSFEVHDAYKTLSIDNTPKEAIKQYLVTLTWYTKLCKREPVIESTVEKYVAALGNLQQTLTALLKKEKITTEAAEILESYMKEYVCEPLSSPI